MKKIILIFLGFICLAVGLLGVVIPILPTTPFVIVASICFGSSSKKLYDKLANTSFFGAYIKNYKEKSGVEKKVKIQSIAFLYTVLIVSASLSKNWAISIVLLVVAVGVTIHILTIKTKKKEGINQTTISS